MLKFREITKQDVPIIAEFTKNCGIQSCDFTLCGIYLWGMYYDYKMCVYEDTLFIKGRDESGRAAFALPIGKMPTDKAVLLIKEYCKNHSILPRFSFVPADVLPAFGECTARKLEGWSDYIYDANSLSALSGKRLHKKKNRFNKFVKTYADYRFEEITENNLADVRDFYDEYIAHNRATEPRLESEELIIKRVFEEYDALGINGGVLYADGRVVAFAFGERVGGTLYVHFEKADRHFDGAYEAVNCLFVRAFANGATYVDREEDMGDEGLRQAKMAYCPIKFVNKYEVVLDE